jgi:hypothetical protein
MNWRWNIATKDDSFFSGGLIHHGHSGYQRLSVGMFGLGADRPGGPLLHYFPQIHHQDSIADMLHHR